HGQDRRRQDLRRGRGPGGAHPHRRDGRGSGLGREAPFRYPCRHARREREKIPMLLAAFYVFAIAAIILHYTGHLKRWNCEWILIVLAIAVFPAVLFL